MNDLVKEIFKRLGVEPNEEFEILCDNNPFSFKCKIDEHLQGYFFTGITGIGWEFFDELLKDLLNGSNTIIKLPKKKHVGDLECEDAHCKDCPLYAIHCFPTNDNLYNVLENWFEEYKDEELYNFLKARLDKEVEE